VEKVDERLNLIEQERNKAIDTSNNTYNDLANNQQTLLDKQNNLASTYEQTRNNALDKQLEQNQTILNQNKEDANNSYKNEAIASKNAYYDYINPYGANKEVEAQNGLNGSGFTETNKTMAWQVQQNRSAQAKASYDMAVRDFNNQMQEAQNNYDVSKAENALAKLQTEAEALNNYTTNVGNIRQQQLGNNQNLDTDYYNRRQNVLDQINYEKEQEQALKQYQEQMAYQKEQDALAQANWEKEFQLAQQKANASASGNSYYDLGSYGGTYDLGSGNKNIVTDYYNAPMTQEQQIAIERYGTMGTTDKNGVRYQPAGVIYDGQDYGALSKAGVNAGTWTGNKNITNSSNVNVANQNVWVTPNGDAWVWNGSKMTYEPIGSPSLLARGIGALKNTK
jgi:hypothetical protein